MSSESAPSRNLARPIRVFLADDHRSTLWGLERLIESTDPKMTLVGSAHDGAQLIAEVERARPDVIVLDLDLAGESALNYLPDLVTRCGAQVLVLTGVRDPQAHIDALLKGARGVVRKEEPAEVLLRAIERVHEGEVWMSRAEIGRMMQTIAGGATGKRSDAHATKLATLTPREREVIQAVTAAKGAKSRVIAEQLRMSEHTLRNHLNVIYEKLQIRGRVELFIYAIEHGLTRRLKRS